ncbi:hypothetical protein MC885_017505 [Smutsia gigantea]|nr:hypothetical protein MC885_017505 [Smutsia gigantea]
MQETGRRYLILFPERQLLLGLLQPLGPVHHKVDEDTDEPHQNGNEDDHKVTGKASKLPPELEGRQERGELYSHGGGNGLRV